MPTPSQSPRSPRRATPRLGRNVFVAPTATVVGDVVLGDFTSIWYGAVLRGDINRIVVGRSTNVQDNAVVHVDTLRACRIGNRVTIGHGAIVHACRVEDEVLIGMGAIILDGAVIGRQSLIGAGALVPGGMRIPPGSLVLGSPAKVVRVLTPAERRAMKIRAREYALLADWHRQHQTKPSAPHPRGRAGLRPRQK